MTELKKIQKPLVCKDFESIALLLQGGGALGSYQAGVYQALSEARIIPNWVAGISIGAINSAIIAGNPPEKRIARLREFWELVTNGCVNYNNVINKFSRGDIMRSMINESNAWLAMVKGVEGFYKPRMFAPWIQPVGSTEATSYYDTKELKSTLERLVDFDRINSGEMRFSVGAVNVRSGNFSYFDTATHEIGPEHIMASGALPPAFPAVEIEGEFYWDGGLVSNTPLQWVLESEKRDTLAFQVDLWSAKGELPRAMPEVSTREKEIRYSSRTRASTDYFRYEQKLRNNIADLLDKLPPQYLKLPEAQHLKEEAVRKVYNIVHLIYRDKNYEGFSKDFEFSRTTMEERWQSGYYDTVRTLRHPEVLKRPTSYEGVKVYDLTRSETGMDLIHRRAAKG